MTCTQDERPPSGGPFARSNQRELALVQREPAQLREGCPSARKAAISLLEKPSAASVEPAGEPKNLAQIAYGPRVPISRISRLQPARPPRAPVDSAAAKASRRARIFARTGRHDHLASMSSTRRMHLGDTRPLVSLLERPEHTAPPRGRRHDSPDDCSHCVLSKLVGRAALSTRSAAPRRRPKARRHRGRHRCSRPLRGALTEIFVCCCRRGNETTRAARITSLRHQTADVDARRSLSRRDRSPRLEGASRSARSPRPPA